MSKPGVITTTEQAGESGYELIARLASGGMGEIFVAQMVRAGGFRKLCVIKRVLPQYAGTESFTTMLLEEARVAAQMTHPNICQVYDFGLMDGLYYLAMEYLAGVSVGDMLRHYASRRQRLDERLVGAVIHQACMGLHYAHEVTDLDGQLLEIVHRDISPSNLMVTTSGTVKVLDFGIAKSRDQRTKTKSGVLKGKAGYMAPEQILGAPIDRRADIFSLGVVMAEMFSARRFFPTSSEYETFKAIVEEPIPSLSRLRGDLPGELIAVADRALARAPEERFQSAAEMAEALTEAMARFGGVMSGPELQRVLSSELGDELERQRALLATPKEEHPRVAADRSLAAIAPSQPVLSDGETVAETRAMSSPPVVRPMVPRPEAAASRSGGRIARVAMLIAIPALVSAAIGLFVLSRRDDGAKPAAPTSVVVYQTELPASEPPARAASEPTPAPAPAEDEPSAAPEPPEPKRTRRAPRDRYKAAIARRRAALLGCFDRVTSVDGAPKLSLRMEIEASGAVGAVSVLPAAVGDAPLGRCIAAKIRGIDFGRHDQAVTVTVPLVIRSR